MMVLYDFPCPYRDVCELGKICCRKGAEVITCEKYLEFVEKERKKVDTILCVLKYRADGYAIHDIRDFCRCSEYMVRKILKQYGDPLKKDRLYMISISGRARRLLVKQHSRLYRLLKSIIEEMYPVEARNGSEAKRKFMEEYPAAAAFFEIVAEKLQWKFPEVLRAYPPYAAYG